jgi:regulator of cell morphogenesis and NO signaling
MSPAEQTLAEVVLDNHEKLRAALAFLGPLVTKVARVHGEHDPRLVEVREIFGALSDALDVHLDLEDRELFRYVGSLPAERDEVERRIEGARREHLAMSAALFRIRELTKDFVVPGWACTSYRTLLAELQALEEDVIRQMRVEDDVLFPQLAEA